MPVCRGLSILAFCFIVAPLAALVLIVGRGSMRAIAALERMSPALVSREATRRVGRECTVGKVELHPGTVTLREVAMADGPTRATSGDLVSARSVTVRFSLDRIRSGSKADPYIDELDVVGARARIARNSAGEWNIAQFLKPRKQKPGRPVIGRIRVTDASARFEDGALWQASGRHEPPVSVQAHRVSGTVGMTADGGVFWSAALPLIDGPASGGFVNGSYNPATRRVLVSMRGSNASATFLRRFVPKGLEFRGGTADVVASLAMGNSRPLSLWADGTVRNVSTTVPGFKPVLSSVRGMVGVHGQLVSVDLSAASAGSPQVAVRGRIDGWRAPTVHARLFTDRVDIGWAVPAFGGAPLPAGMRMVAGGAGVVSGSLASPMVLATGQVSLSGDVPGARLRAPAQAAVVVTGQLRRPELVASAQCRTVEFQGATGGAVRGVLAYRDGAWSAQGVAHALGGQVFARALYKSSGQDIDILACARHLSLARAGGVAGIPDWMDRLSGQADADARLTRHRGDRWGADWLAQGTGLRFDTWHADVADLAGASVGTEYHLDRLALQDGTARVVGFGSGDAGLGVAELNVAADGLDAAKLARSAGIDVGDTCGYLFLRGAHLKSAGGPLGLDGTGLLYNFGVGNYTADEAVVGFGGDLRRLWFEASAGRSPARASLTGELRGLDSGAATIALVGVFSDLDVGDAARMASRDLQVAGVVRGGITVEGPLSAPDLAITPIQGVDLSFGDLTAPVVQGSLAYHASGDDAGWTGLLDHCRLLGGNVKGQVRLSPQRLLTASGKATGLDVGALASLDASIPMLRGAITAEGTISVPLSREWPNGLVGDAQVSTTMIALAGEPVGSLAAHLKVEDSVVSGADGGPAVTLGGGAVVGEITTARYDWLSHAVSGSGSIASAPLPAIRRLMSGVPAVMATANPVAAEWLNPLGKPISGEVGATFQVDGRTDRPHLVARLSGHKVMAAGEMLDDLNLEWTGDGTAYRAGASIHTGDLVAEASYSRAADGRAGGLIDVSNLTLPTLERFLPSSAPSLGVTGTLDVIHAEVSGQPGKLEVDAYAEARGLAWRDPDPTRQAQAYTIDAVRLGGLKVADGRLSVTDLSVRLPGTAQAAGSSERPNELYISGSAPFMWDDPYIPPGSLVEIEARLPRQSLDVFKGLMPGLEADMKGAVEGQVTYKGALETISRPDRAIASGGASLNGWLALQAERLRFADMRTSLADVDACLEFAGDRVRVANSRTTGKPFSARVRIYDPVTRKFTDRPVDSASGQLHLTGELPLVAQAPVQDPLTLSGDTILFAEPVLPIWRSGSAVGEIGGGLAGVKGLSITVAGSLATPHISGAVHVRRAQFRLPETDLPPQPVRAAPPVNPTFDVRCYIDQRMEVTNRVLAASVDTLPIAPVRLAGDLAAPELSGDLRVVSGTLSFPTGRFTIRKGGSVSLRYPPFGQAMLAEPYLEVSVDLSATARLTATSASGVRRRYTVYVDARGPINSDNPLALEAGSGLGRDRRLRLAFRSDPPDLAMSQDGLQRRVTALLGGQEALQEVFGRGGGGGRALGGQLADMLYTSIMPDIMEKTGLARAFGLGDLSLDYDQVDRFALRLTRPLVGPFEISYWQRLSAAREVGGYAGASWELKLSGRLNRHINLSWTTDDQRTNAYVLEGVYRF